MVLKEKWTDVIKRLAAQNKNLQQALRETICEDLHFRFDPDPINGWTHINLCSHFGRTCLQELICDALVLKDQIDLDSAAHYAEILAFSWVSESADGPDLISLRAELGI